MEEIIRTLVNHSNRISALEVIEGMGGGAGGGPIVGTPGQIVKFTGVNAIGDSLVYEDAVNAGWEVPDDWYLGLAENAGRLVWDSTPAPDEIRVVDANLDLNDNDFILDADGDSYLHAAADDHAEFVLAGAGGQLDVNINAADDFTFTANSLNVLSGSYITMADDTWIGLAGPAGRLVFDSTAAPDTVTFLDCEVGIGAAPVSSADLEVIRSNTAAEAAIEAFAVTTIQMDGRLYFIRSNTATIGSWITTIDTQYLGEIQFLGVNTTPAAAQGALIRAIQDGAAGVAVPTKLILQTSTNAAANSNQLVLESDGSISVNGNLDINGNDFIIDADGDSYIHEVADDQVALVLAGAGGQFDININAAVDFTFTANVLDVLAGSKITLTGGELEFTAAGGSNLLEVIDNDADAWHLSDVGPLEYMRIVSTDANPYVIFDPAAAGINVGIGTTVPIVPLQVGVAVGVTGGAAGGQVHVYGANRTVIQNGNLQVITTDTQAIDKGGFIGLGGLYSGVANHIDFGGIAGRKENAVNANTAGYLALSTRPAGAVMVERVRITSTGDVGIGAVAPGSLMEWNFADEDLEFVDAHVAVSVATVEAVAEVITSTGGTGYVAIYSSFGT